MTKYGQHFLIDHTVLQSMVDLVRRHGSQDTILEIGPGKGMLTAKLVKLARRVIAIEIDHSLAPHLDPLCKKYPNLTVIYGDVLKTNLTDLGLQSGTYSLASNLPYDITGIVLRQFLTQAPWPTHMALLIQKEVAERVTAKPGNLSILGLSVQAFSYPNLIRLVPPEAFSPKPKVHSAIISLESIHQHDKVAPDLVNAWFRLVKAGFAQKRKLLKSNIHNINVPKELIASSFAELGLKETVRAQELSLKQWVQLVDKLHQFIV